MKPTPCSPERITTQDLLLARWHGVDVRGKQFWANPDISPSFLGLKSLKPFISKELIARISEPVIYFSAAVATFLYLWLRR